MEAFKTFMLVGLLVLLVLLVPISPLFTLWSFAALGWSIPVTVKTYFAVLWLHFCLGTLFSNSRKK